MSQSIRPATGDTITGGPDRQRRIAKRTLSDLEKAHKELEAAITAIRGKDGYKTRTPAQEEEAKAKSLQKLDIKEQIVALQKKLGTNHPARKPANSQR